MRQKEEGTERGSRSRNNKTKKVNNKRSNNALKMARERKSLVGFIQQIKENGFNYFYFTLFETFIIIGVNIKSC